MNNCMCLMALTVFCLFEVSFSTARCQVRDSLTADRVCKAAPSSLTPSLSPCEKNLPICKCSVSVQALHKATTWKGWDGTGWDEQGRAGQGPSVLSSCSKAITNDPGVSSALLLTGLANLKFKLYPFLFWITTLCFPDVIRNLVVY